ncbi:N-acetylmuramoyl-L-alanine amidase [Halobacillus litoralis]|uniref:SH3 domain-containing protein n=1 Tax=Halobacillus litoralis TaxID=45668 RepID=UPI001CFCAF48|nr:SH3 domain-containing protein [Halobacillus litoralis]WLR46168.1 N-acetylmuramoyl-L-alanine amidase [Halobacillus litoralis]
MKKGIIFFIFILGVLSFYETPSVYADKAVIQVDHLNVRTGPGTNYDRIGKVHTRETYMILDKKDDWLKIQRSGKDGWVAKWLTKVKADQVTAERHYSKYDYLRIRSAPNLDGKIEGYLMKGDVVEPKKKDGKWVYVQKGSTKGWVHGDYLTKQNSETHEPPKEKEADEGPSSTVKGKVKVGTAVLNVRSENSTRGRILTIIRKGETYEYIAKKDRWYQIKYSSGNTGWVAGWLVNETDNDQTNTPASKNTYVSLNYNGTNLRSGPSTNYKIVGRGHKGDRFEVLSKEGQWYKISYNSKTAYVAGWIVEEVNQESASTAPATSNSLKGKTIMIDAGHGGRDPGAVGRSGSFEKTLTLDTAFLLKSQLESKGAKVLMTRTNDQYISLSIRSFQSNRSNADAFISLHYNAAPLNIIARGLNSYYYSPNDKALADALQTSLVSQTRLRDRGTKKGNFHVIRENNKPSVLLELGFLSDAREEQTVKTRSYQMKASQGITEGLINYFN